MPWPNYQALRTGQSYTISIYQGAADGDLNVVSDLLDGGVDVNIRDELLYAALHCAVYYNKSAMVQLLLLRGADASLRDIGTYDEPDGFTAVENAARLNMIAVMQEFVAYKIDIESSNAVYLAAREDHLDMLRFLFDSISSISSVPY